MGKGGDQTTTTKVELDPAIREEALNNIDIANEVSALGYTPYTGNTVAGFSPQQMSAMQATDQGMAAFGMPSAVDWQQGGNGSMAAPSGMSSDAIYTALTGMPPPTTDAGGFSGYSAMPMYNEAIENTPAAQLAAIRSFVMDPETGAGPTNLSVPQPRTSFVPDGRGGFTATENPNAGGGSGRGTDGRSDLGPEIFSGPFSWFNNLGSNSSASARSAADRLASMRRL